MATILSPSPPKPWSNPAGTDGFEFVEYTAEDPAQLAALFESMGFEAVARHRSKDVTLFRQNDVNFIVNGERDSFAQSFARVHGPSVCAIAFRVINAADAYRHVLSDEFQDVCAIQYALLRLLAERHRNLAVVGDPCQTLYGWRGADIQFLLDFQRDFPETTIISLDRNFRSTGHVVAVANALGAALPYQRSLWTENPPGAVVQLHIASDEQADAGFIAAEIELADTE